jgi:hypothetical protein
MVMITFKLKGKAVPVLNLSTTRLRRMYVCAFFLFVRSVTVFAVGKGVWLFSVSNFRRLILSIFMLEHFVDMLKY